MNKSIDKKSKIIISQMVNKSLKNTPFFAVILTIIGSLAFFFVLVAAIVPPDEIKASNFNYVSLPAVIFANNSQSVFHGQVWRIFTFFLIENVSGIFAIITFILLLLFVFIPAGYNHELIMGSKKTALILIPSVLMIGLLQVGLTNNAVVYYFGIQNLSWILLGSLIFIYLFKETENSQLKLTLRPIILKIFVFSIIFEVLRVQGISDILNNKANITNNPLLNFQIYYFLFPLMGMFFGFLGSFFFELKNLDNLSIYFLIGIAIITFLVAIYFVILNFMDLPLFPSNSPFSFRNIKRIFNSFISSSSGSG